MNLKNNRIQVKKRYSNPKNFKNKKKYNQNDFFDNTVGVLSFSFAISALGLENWKAIIWTTISSIIILLIIYKKRDFYDKSKKSIYQKIIETPIYLLGFISLFGLTMYNYIYYYLVIKKI
jgi:hypothetical protein